MASETSLGMDSKHETKTNNLPQNDEDDSQSGIGSGSGSGSGSDSESDAEPVLAVTRERRANAGSRMAQLLKLAGDEDAALGTTGEEDTEDQYADIFQEAADDKEFQEGRDDDADVDMSSSSDEDDAVQDGDEEAGERELHKEKMLEKGKKRKKMSLLQQTMRLKKLKYAPILQQSSDTDVPKAADTTTTATTVAAAKPGPRPKKKLERVTWLPDIAGTRSSMRKATVHNKQATHKRLKEHEKKRKQTMAQLQAAEDRRKAKEAPPMTQEERLVRAAETERINLTSVNSWEAIEQQRQEERNAKLAALKNRTLEGPVITFWSGPAIWVNGRLQHVGKPRLIEDLEPEPQAEEVPEQIEVDVTEGAHPGLGTEIEKIVDEIGVARIPGAEQPVTNEIPSSMELDIAIGQSLVESMKIHQSPEPEPQKEVPDSAEKREGGFLEGIEFWASIPDSKSPTHASAPSVSGTPQLQEETLAGILSSSSAANRQPMTMPSAAPTVLPLLSTQREIQLAEDQNMQYFGALPDVDMDLDPPIEELAARSLITLTSFTKLEQRTRRYDPTPVDDAENGMTIGGGRWGGARVSAAEKDREVLLKTLFSIPPDLSNLSLHDADPSSMTLQTQGYDPLIPASAHPRHNARYLSKRAQHCAITGQIARYRDPATGLPYASAAAYRSVKKVLSGQGAWSSLLQCWIGEVKPAKGVPESVWFGTKDAVDDKSKDEESRTNDTSVAGAKAEASKTKDDALADVMIVD